MLERKQKLYIPIQAHFTPPLKIKKRVEGVTRKRDRTIVRCKIDDQGRIILPPVIEEATSFGGDKVRKPEYFLFTSESGGPEPVWSSSVTGQIASWRSGFSRIICGPQGEKLSGFVRQENRIVPQRPRVLFRARELYRIDVRYSRDGRVAYLTISHHQIIDGEDPRYQMEILLETKLNFNEDYLGALEEELEKRGLEDFEVPASIAVEMGYRFPNGARPKSPALRNLSNKERATTPIFYQYSSEGETEAVTEEEVIENGPVDSPEVETESDNPIPDKTSSKEESVKKTSKKKS